MNQLWARTIGAGVVVILGALLLKVAPPIVVLGVFVGGIAFLWVIGRRRARTPMPGGGAELLGLKRETADPFGILGYPMALFGRATDPAIDELVWGRWRGIDVHAFSLSLETPSPADEPRERRTFACAMASVDGPVPGLVAEPQTFLTMLGAPAPGSSIQLGDAALDAAINVWSEDEEHARRVLDEAGRAWLRSLDQDWGFEARGRVAIVYGPKPERPDLVATLEVLRDMLERLRDGLGAASPTA